MTPFIISSPLEQFEVTKVIGLDVVPFGINLALTNLGFYVILTLVLFLGLMILSGGTGGLLPTRWGLGFESAYTTVRIQTLEQVGIANEAFFPTVFTLFFFLAIANLMGNVPYGFALFTSVVISMGLSVTIFLGVTIMAVAKHGLHFLSFFLPAGTPGPLVPMLVLIELISYIARAFSLGIRLFANLVAGHSLLAILGGMLYGIATAGFFPFIGSLVPMTIFLALVGLEIAVSLIQAYVFTLLFMSYLSDAINLH